MRPFDHDVAPARRLTTEAGGRHLPEPPRELLPDLGRTLRSVVAGEVTVPGDDGYDEARRAWHLVTDQHPAAVVRAVGVQDVASTVTIARDLGLSVSPQPGGHGATGSVDGTIVLRTGALDELSVNLFTRRARVGAGVKWGRALDSLDGTGLIALAGSSADTTVVGYTVGGGLSWFSRQHGYAAHSVHALEIVDARGRRARVTADDDPDLFWALRGGGGDFGVVTAVELDLHRADRLYGGGLAFPGERLRQVWDAYLEVVGDAPDELSAWLRVLRLPHLDVVPEPMRGSVVVAVYFTYLGDAKAAERLIAPIRRAGARLMDTVDAFPISGLGAVADEPEDPVPAALDSVLLDDLGPDVFEATKATMLEPGSVLNMVSVRHLGGALSRSSADHGAAGTVDEPFSLMAGGIAPDVALLDPIQAGTEEFVSRLVRPGHRRTLYNFSDRVDPADSLPAATLDRLRRIKRGRDPLGVIRGNRPVLLPETTDDLDGI